uniref:Transmembrane protein 240 n=1 Tax=Gasterosteus aculeatus aculeatus TaxID=481459 RepID=A0AAQ4PFI0_GASAC|nr:transmembrane protein 240-like isoform X2 [Gasterosteus aculeatus aculeatus]
MNALFDRFHNFILPIVRGEDAVCGCTCGRHQVYHVVPYNEAMEDNMVNWQEMNVVVGLLLGLCSSLFLQCLQRIWHSRVTYWRLDQIYGEAFWSWMPKLKTTKELVRKLHPKPTEDSTGNMLHINQDVQQNVNDT